MRLAHQGWLSDHLSIADTTRKVIEQSYWPRVQGDVWRFCRACNKCQEATRRTGGETVPLDEEQTKGEGEYELFAVEVEEERVLGTMNGTVPDSPRTVSGTVKEVLWDNTR